MPYRFGKTLELRDESVSVALQHVSSVSPLQGCNNIASNTQTSDPLKGALFSGKKQARKCMHNIQKVCVCNRMCVFACISRNGHFDLALFCSCSPCLALSLFQHEQVIFLSGFRRQKRAHSQISQIPSSMIPLITDGSVKALSKCSLVYS